MSIRTLNPSLKRDWIILLKNNKENPEIPSGSSWALVAHSDLRLSEIIILKIIHIWS